MRRWLVQATIAGCAAVVTAAVGGAVRVRAGLLTPPLPWSQPGRLVSISEVSRVTGTNMTVAPVDYLRWRGRESPLTDIGAYVLLGHLTFDGRNVAGAAITTSLLHVLGVHPLLGASDLYTSRVGPANVLLSWQLWRRTAGDRGSIGRRIVFRKDGKTTTMRVAGVMPPHFTFPEPIFRAARDEAWEGLVVARGLKSGADHYLNVIGRMRHGVSIGETRAFLESRLPAHSRRRERIAVEPLAQAMYAGRAKAAMIVALAAWTVALGSVLILAALLSTELTARSDELALRQMLGATPGRLLGMVALRVLVPSATGAAVGCVAVPWTAFMWARAAAEAGPWSSTASAGIATGTLAALAVSSTALGVSLLAWRARGAQGAARARATLNRTLMAISCAGGLILAAIALAIGGQLWHTSLIEPGTWASRLLVVRLVPPNQELLARRHRIAYYRSMMTAILAEPGVRTVGVINTFPPGNYPWTISYGARSAVATIPEVVSTSYFRMMHIPLVRGRLFRLRDALGGVPVAIVSTVLAREIEADGDPVGEMIHVGHTCNCKIIGVVGQEPFVVPRPVASVPQLYISYRQFPDVAMTVVVRAANPLGLWRTMRVLIATRDPAAWVPVVSTVKRLWLRATAVVRAAARLTGALALLAVAMSFSGGLGVAFEAVCAERRNLAIRAALGATPIHCMGQLWRISLVPSIVGLLCGGGAVIALGRVIAATIPGASGVATSLPYATALVSAASLIPPVVSAWTVMKEDPAKALREL